MDGIADLERSCIAPGWWLIEGFNVMQKKERRRWVVYFPEPRSFETLKEAKSAIVDYINGKRD